MLRRMCLLIPGSARLGFPLRNTAARSSHPEGQKRCRSVEGKAEHCTGIRDPGKMKCRKGDCRKLEKEFSLHRPLYSESPMASPRTKAAMVELLVRRTSYGQNTFQLY